MRILIMLLSIICANAFANDIRDVDKSCRDNSPGEQHSTSIIIAGCVYRNHSTCEVIVSKQCFKKCRLVLEDQLNDCYRWFEHGRNASVGYNRAAVEARLNGE